MDSLRPLTKKERRRLSQRATRFEQIEPVEGAQAAAEQPVEEPIIGGMLSSDDALETISKSMTILEKDEEKARLTHNKKYIANFAVIREEMALLYKKCKKEKEEGKEVTDIPFLNLNLDVSFSLSETTRSEIYQEHLPPHIHLAEKVFDYLSMCYGLRIPSDQENDELYEKFMGESVLSFCILYRDQWREKFKTVHKTLVKLEYFVLHTCAIPVLRDSHYFFNYLLRLAIIFEMSVYCYDYNYDYFEIAKKCASQFVDVMFFRDEGSWTSLRIAASVVASVTRPLRFAVSCPKQDIGSFGDVIERLEEYASKGVINMTSDECSLLKEVDEMMGKLCHNISTSSSNFVEFIMNYLRLNKHDLMSVMMKYFAECLPEDYAISLDADMLSDNLIDVDAWIHNSSRYDEVLKLFKSHQQGDTDDLCHELSNHLLDCVIDCQNLEFAWGKLVGMEPASPKKNAQVSPRHVPSKKTATVPKRRNPVPVRESGHQFSKRFVEGISGLYARTLPSFIDNYVAEYLSTSYGLQTSERDEMFLIDAAYYAERKSIGELPESLKRMSGCLLPDKTPVVVPIQVQRRLDAYFDSDPDAKERVFKGTKSLWGVPKIPKTVNDAPVWVITGTLWKHGSSLRNAAETMEQFREMLNLGTSKAETEEEEDVHMFRLSSASEVKLLLPASAVPLVPLFQDLRLPRHCGKKKKNQKKKGKK